MMVRCDRWLQRRVDLILGFVHSFLGRFFISGIDSGYIDILTIDGDCVEFCTIHIIFQIFFLFCTIRIYWIRKYFDLPISVILFYDIKCFHGMKTNSFQNKRSFEIRLKILICLYQTHFSPLMHVNRNTTVNVSIFISTKRSKDVYS